MGMNSPKDAGERIVAYRATEGLSTGEFAKKVGVTRQSVWYWETGRRTPRGEALAKLQNVGLYPIADRSTLLRRATERLAIELGIEVDEISIIVQEVPDSSA